jgi:hypothetical protein
MTEGYDFDASKYIGRNFESILIDYFRKKGYTVEDKTQDMEHQKAGIDFVINKIPVDAKYDRWLHTTGNVAIELISNLGRGTVGTALHTKADRWLYGEMWTDDDGIIHLICHYWTQPLLIRQIEEDEQRKWTAFKTTTSGRDGGVLYATVGLLVPLDWIKAKGQAVRYGCIDLTRHCSSLKNAA